MCLYVPKQPVMQNTVQQFQILFVMGWKFLAAQGTLYEIFLPTFDLTS